MKFLTASTFAAATGLVAATSLSTGCQTALKGILGSPDAACLNPSALLSFFVGNNQSVPTVVNTWLEGVCSQGSCSNATLSEIATNITTGCASDLGSTGTSAASTVTQLVQEVYPTVREMLCLSDNKSGQLCVTEMLNSVQAISTLTLSNFDFASLLSTIQQVVVGAQNIACTNCTAAMFNVASKLSIPEFSLAVDGIDTLCGANFVENGSDLSAEGVTQTAPNEAFETKKNAGFSMRTNVGAVLLLVFGAMLFA
ncbi:hypothetical protein HMN09_00771200 [Mycena chlorophos]|uniref:Uncharacterized protein n=2 Tax=Mycena chlorophos TaxID=658473 RepID=A0ABQ0M243_MYCCL|nr:hypothetical protein HMN09_00771200 [Mycena chlorophos]GAT56246.1 predicted protein [Mycena chlorophos]